MLTLAELRASPRRLAELGGDDVLLSAASGNEVVVHEAPETHEATLVFQHETIGMMRAERAAELEKLGQQLGPKSVVIAIRKKPGSFWDQITVGRAPSSDVVLADPAVSNVHAHFELAADSSTSVRDLGSSNGTFVNRAPLQPHDAFRLRGGDCIRFGQSVFYFVPSAMLKDLLR